MKKIGFWIIFVSLAGLILGMFIFTGQARATEYEYLTGDKAIANPTTPYVVTTSTNDKSSLAISWGSPDLAALTNFLADENKTLKPASQIKFRVTVLDANNKVIVRKVVAYDNRYLKTTKVKSGQTYYAQVETIYWPKRNETIGAAMAKQIAVTNAGAVTEGLPNTSGQLWPSADPTTWSINDIGKLIANLTKVALMVAGGLALIYLIIGSYHYFLAFGNEAVAKQGLQTITWAIIGIVVVLLAYIIVNEVSQFVGGIKIAP